MIGALIYLQLTSLKNRLSSQVRRLRRPKYFFGAIVGILYFWFFFLRRLWGNDAFTPANAAHLPGPDLQVISLGFTLVAISAVMLLRIGAAWLASTGRPGIQFSEPEIAFLFPAPISRRTLVHYRLASGQFRILLTSLFLTLISGRGSAWGGGVLARGLAWWTMLSIIDLHTMGASFTVMRLIDGGVSRRRRQAAVVAVLATIIGALAWGVWRTSPAIQDAALTSLPGLMNYIRQVTDSGLLRWVLLPFRLILAPFFATGWPEFLRAFWPAFLILAAHYAWVLRTETAFEEASIALAEKRAKVIAAMQAGNYRLGTAPARGRREPFRLKSSGGRPEIAFLWKNLLSAPSYLNHRTFLYSAGIMIVLASWLARGDETHRTVLSGAGGFALIVAVYTLMLGPQLARQDLRSDLVHADILKTYPLPGWQLVLGELLTPVAILTGLLWLTLLAGTLSISLVRPFNRWLEPDVRIAAAVCVALVVPPLCLLQLMIPNAAAVVFPSWAQTTRSRDRGIDLMGQRLIFIAGQLLVILLALLPAAGLGVLLWFAADWVLDAAGSTAVATAGVLGVLGLEVCLGLWWLGGRFEKLDLSSEAVK